MMRYGKCLSGEMARMSMVIDLSRLSTRRTAQALRKHRKASHATPDTKQLR